MKSWKNGLRAIKELIAGWLFPRAARCLCCGDPRRASEEDCLCGACREKLKEWRVPASACERCLSPVTPGRPCAFCASPMMRPIEAVFALPPEAREKLGAAGTSLIREQYDYRVIADRYLDMLEGL